MTEPPVGFFLAGSMIEMMNGVYVQQSPPQYDDDEPGTETLLYYCNVDNNWTMECVKRRKTGASWALVDESGTERFIQKPARLVPGAGLRWQHHIEAASSSSSPSATTNTPRARPLTTQELTATTAASETGRGGSPSSSSSAAQPAKESEDDLPWQVIAILDRVTLQEVLAGLDAHKQRKRAEAERAAKAAAIEAGGAATAEAAVDVSDAAAGGGGIDHELDALAKEVDHYNVLGVSHDASEKRIVQAYRMCSLKYHPDRRGGSTAAFQRVQLAYSVLSDEERRRTYDAGEQEKQGAAAAGDGGSKEEEDERWKTAYHPFGSPFIYKNKLREEKRRKEAERQARRSSRR